jgi:hypothetical protein
VNVIIAFDLILSTNCGFIKGNAYYYRHVYTYAYNLHVSSAPSSVASPILCVLFQNGRGCRMPEHGFLLIRARTLTLQLYDFESIVRYQFESCRTRRIGGMFEFLIQFVNPPVAPFFNFNPLDFRVRLIEGLRQFGTPLSRFFNALSLYLFFRDLPAILFYIAFLRFALGIVCQG